MIYNKFMNKQTITIEQECYKENESIYTSFEQEQNLIRHFYHDLCNHLIGLKFLKERNRNEEYSKYLEKVRSEYEERKRNSKIKSEKTIEESFENKKHECMLQNQFRIFEDGETKINDIYEQIIKEDLTIEEFDALLNALAEIRKKIYTDDASINTLINYFKSECMKQNIDLDVSISGSLKNKLQDHDLNILLNSVLEKAFHSTTKYIHLEIRSTNGNIIILVENTDDTDTQRHDSETEIIKTIVNKYNGYYSSETKDNVMYTNIMIVTI